jgi:hypothetical protein
MKVRVPVFFYLPGFGKSKNPPYLAGETSHRNAQTEEDALPMLYKKPREGFYHDDCQAKLTHFYIEN